MQNHSVSSICLDTHKHTEKQVHGAEQVVGGKMATQAKQRNWVKISALLKDMKVSGMVISKD